MADDARDDRCAPCTRASLHVRDPSFVQPPLVHSLLAREISSGRTRKVHAEHAIRGRRRRVLRMGWECTCVEAVPSRSCSFSLLFFARFHPRSRKNTILASTHHRHSLHVCVADAWPTSPAFFGPSTVDDVARARIVQLGSILQFVHVRSEPWRHGVQTRKRRRDQQAWRWERRTVAHVRRTTRHLEGKVRGDGT